MKVKNLSLSARRLTRRVAVVPRVQAPPRRNRSVNRDILTRLSQSVATVGADLFRKPEVTILLLVAAAFTLSATVTPSSQKDLFDQLIDRFKAIHSLAPLADTMETYKKEIVIAFWFVAVYFAVQPKFAMVVVIVALLTITVFDFSMLYGAVIAMGSYVFLSIKDRSVRMVLIAIGAVYTYLKLFQNPVHAPRPPSRG